MCLSGSKKRSSELLYLYLRAFNYLKQAREHEQTAMQPNGFQHHGQRRVFVLCFYSVFTFILAMYSYILEKDDCVSFIKPFF